MLLLGALVVPGASFGGRVLFDRDIHLTWQAHATAFVEACRAGVLPLWDPHFGFGQPQLANPQTQTLYPLTWLLLVLPPWRYYTLLVVVHLALAGLGAALLLRSWGASRWAAFAGGGLFLLSGPVVSLASTWHQLCGAAWLPWAWLAADRLCERPRAAASARLAGVLVLQLLAGSGEASLMTGLLVGVRILAALDWRRPAASGNRRLLSGALAALLVTALLAAPQWLPTAELTVGSARAQLSLEARTFWSVHPRHLLQTLLPVPLLRLTGPTADPVLLRETLEPFLYSLYLGLPALALAMGGLSVAPRRLPLAILLVVGLLFSLGRHSPAYAGFVLLLPPLHLLRFPVKAMLLVALPWSLLAALGFDAWRQDRLGRGARLACAALLAAGAATLVVLPALPFSLQAWPAFPLQRPPAVAAGLAAVTGAACLASCLRRTRVTGRHVAWLALLASLLDLTSLHAQLNPTAPVELYTSVPPTVAAIRQDHAESGNAGALPARVHAWDYGSGAPGGSAPDRSGFFREVPADQPPQLARARGLQAYLYPFVPGRYGLDGSYSKDLFGLFPGPLHDLTLLVRQAGGSSALLPLLRMGSVDYVSSVHDAGPDGLRQLGSFPGFFREPIRVFAVPAPLPRAHVVDSWKVADGLDAYGLLLSGRVDVAREALLADGTPKASDPGALMPPGRARIVRRDAETLDVEAELDRPGMVVVSDAFGAGWRAQLDGRPVRVRRADLAFRGVEVPAGHHTIEMRYRPPGLRLGLALGALGLAAFLALLAAARRDR